MKQERLIQLEKIIQKNQRSFYVIGKALKEIRDNRLYRVVLFETFETYTRDRWEIGKSHAYRLIEAYKVIDNLSPIGDMLPENESQVRELSALEPHAQRQIWRDFLKTGMELKARNIKKFVTDRKTGQIEVPLDLTHIMSDSFREVTLAMLEQIRFAQNEGWQSTSQEAALLWNKVMKDKILGQCNHERG